MASVSKTRHYIVLGTTVVLLSGVGVMAYLVGKNADNGGEVKQFVLTEDVKAGHSIEGKYKEVLRSVDDSVEAEYCYSDVEDLKDLVTQIDLYSHQVITKSNTCKQEDIERTLDFSIEVDVASTIANSIKSEDVVALKVKFDDERKDAVIVPKINVNEIRDDNGKNIEKDDTSSKTPGFLLFKVSNEEADLLNSASKEGVIYVVRYRDLSKADLENTYKIPEVQEEESDTPAV